MDYLCNLLMRAAHGGLAYLGCLVYCSSISDSSWTCFLREIPLLRGMEVTSTKCNFNCGCMYYMLLC